MISMAFTLGAPDTVPAGDVQDAFPLVHRDDQALALHQEGKALAISGFKGVAV